MSFIAIVVVSALVAIGYGMAHAVGTAWVCPEYFLLGPRVVDSNDPMTLAMFFGARGTWWLGLGLGLLLAIAARLGARPPRRTSSLLRPMVVLCAACGAGAFIGGDLGYWLATWGHVQLFEPTASELAVEKHADYVTCVGANLGAYVASLIGGPILCVKVWSMRRWGWSYDEKPVRAIRS